MRKEQYRDRRKHSMKHIIRMVHRLTDDQTGVYFSCEENGQVLFASDLKKNGMLHINDKDGGDYL